MTTTLEDHLAARRVHQDAVGQKLCEILGIIEQAQTDGLYPDGLTAELAQVRLLAMVNAKVLCAQPEPEEEPQAAAEPEA
ncbi:hypothetical protein NI456_01295 [Brevundimonas diminuta]|uniref:hypothetical protein n=1 Tax=Brevundimonas diminuta TaxID=293 RepID=UPI00209848DA|nr:hypothetical protein [Brevundimonas diminuta]MCO8017483.1 hypothetical protein [Brevundimonas diminuta]MCO8021003.1 hypothetical protein [Brevundimonas diminuta]